MSQWFDQSSNANKLRQSYLKGFLDISGGGIYLRSDNSLNFYTTADGVNPNFALNATNITVKGKQYSVDADTSITVSNSKLAYLVDLSENAQLQLNQIINSTKYIHSDASANANTIINVRKGDISANNSIVVTGHIIPSKGEVYDLGSAAQPFNALYLKNNTIYFDSLADAAPPSAMSFNTGSGTLDVSFNGSTASSVMSYNSEVKIGYGAAFSTDAQANLDVSGTLRATLDVSFNSKLFVGDDGKFFADLEVLGDLSVNALKVGGPVTLGDTLTVTKGTTLSSTLTVDKAATLSSTLTVDKAATLSDTLTVAKAATLSSTLDVTLAATLSDALTVAKAATLSSTLDVAKAATLSDALTVAKAATLSSTLDVTLAATLSDTLTVAKAATLSSTLDVTLAATLSDALTVAKAATLSSTLDVAKAATLSSTLAVMLDASLNSRLSVGGDASFNGDIDLDGDLVIRGNLSVYQQQNTMVINTTINNYEVVITTDISLNGDLLVGNDVSMNGKLFVHGEVSMNDVLVVGDDVTFNSKLTVMSDVSFETSLSVGHNIELMSTANNQGFIYQY